MRLTLCSEVIRDLPFRRQCEFAASVGYGGLEIAPFTLGPEPHLTSSRQIAECRRAAADAGIEITGIHWLLVAPEGLSITSADPAVWGKTRDVVAGLIRLTAELGGRYVVHGSPGQRALSPGDEEEGRKRALDLLGHAAQVAEEAGVTYCLEPLSPEQTNFVTSLDEAIKVVEAIGSPAFRTMLDCSAAGVGESDDIPTLLRRHLPSGMIRHVHFNDPNRRGPGEGDMRFAPIVRTLAELRYKGWVGVEPFVYEPDGPACAARAAGYVQGLVEANG